MKSKRRYFKQIRIAQFRAMIELSRGKGFSAAAEALELATPSVWQQVRALEDELGVSLIEVNRQSVSLTEQGQLLVELAEPIVHGFDSLLEEFNQLAQVMPRGLAVASPANILVNELPAPIRQYYQRYSDVELSLIDVASNQARKLLEEGEVDLAVAGQLETSFPSSLCADLITQFPFMLVCPEDHPILDIKRITPKSLVRFPLVMSSEGTNTRTRVDQVFADAGLSGQCRIVCQTSTKDLLLRFVQFGFGIAIVPISPQYTEKSDPPYGDIQRLRFRDVSRVFGHEQIVILRRRHRHEPPHQQAFREIVMQSIH